MLGGTCAGQRAARKRAFAVGTTPTDACDARRLPNQVTSYYNYDDAGRLTGEDWLDGSGQGLYAFDYRFDAVRNRTQRGKLA
ncbi:MAG: hypothetical protein ABFE16_02505 [Armatimonadia bacterium]